jgi:hypothetical protein
MIKQRVIFEDVDYVEVSLTAAMGATATSAAIDNGSRLPRQGRIRAVSGSIAEEMYYTSAFQRAASVQTLEMRSLHTLGLGRPVQQ